MAGTHSPSLSRGTRSLPGNDSTTSTAGFSRPCGWGTGPCKSSPRRIDGPTRQNRHHRTTRPARLGPEIGSPSDRGALHGRNVYPCTRARSRGNPGLRWLFGNTDPDPSSGLSLGPSPSLAEIRWQYGSTRTSIPPYSPANAAKTDAHC